MLLVVTFTAGAQELQMASLGDFRLESGEVIRDCKLGYRAFGKLNPSRSNAVLFPTWFTGTTAELAGNVGPDKLVDPSLFYVILVDALGDGVSSSPSNSTLQPRLRFPRFTIRDMVRAEHQLVTQVLGIAHLHAVIGISMGGMQTFEWIVSYPDMMSKAVPIVGSPQLTGQDLLLWQSELRAIEENGQWRGGEYEEPFPMRAVADIHTFALTTPHYRASETTRQKYPQFISETEEKGGVMKFDANNWYRQLQAMMAHDIAQGGTLAGAAAKVKAQVLVVAASQDHMVNPEPAMEFARLLHAQTVVLAGDCGHLAPGCESAKANPAVRAFLEK